MWLVINLSRCETQGCFHQHESSTYNYKHPLRGMTKGGQIEFVKLIRIGTNANCNVTSWYYGNRNLFFIFYFHILAERTSAYLRQELLFDGKSAAYFRLTNCAIGNK